MGCFVREPPSLIVGAVLASLLFGGSLIQPVETLAGFATSPGPRGQSSTLVRSSSSGQHINEVIIEL
jgi:hypothetical protein